MAFKVPALQVLQVLRKSFTRTEAAVLIFQHLQPESERYATLFHPPPLRFNYVGGFWD
jgi:hypothetical protein